MIKTIIVEDDPRYSDRLIQLLKKADGEVEVLAVSASIEEGIRAIANFRPELVFLDIELGPDTGFDLLKEIEIIDFDVIFTTSHINKYIRDIRACGLSYLPKPIDLGELEEALKKFKEKVSYKKGPEQVSSLKANLQTNRAEEKIIWVNDSENNYFPIEVKNIIFCASENQYTHFFIKEDNKEKLKLMETKGFKHDTKGVIKWVSTKGIGEWENDLEPFRFCRIHNRNLVNLMHVVKYTKGEGGTVLLSTGSSLDVSKEKKTRFLKLSGMKLRLSNSARKIPDSTGNMLFRIAPALV